jgi:uncharacterized membrane protein
MKKENKTGAGIAIGTAIGAVIGFLTGNFGIWIGVGIAIGAGVGNSLSEKNNNQKDDKEPSQDFISKNEQDATDYFQLGVSIDPFAKKKSK